MSKITAEDLDLARRVSVIDYLKGQGIEFNVRGGKMYCSSPFSEDIEPSLCVYPENTWYDFSSGLGGDSVELIRKLHGVGFQDAIRILNSGNKLRLSDVQIKKAKSDKARKKFSLGFYRVKDPYIKGLINAYASKRCFAENSYIPCSYYEPLSKKVKNPYKEKGIMWNQKPAVGFVHVDENMNDCGVKFRSIEDNDKPRFSARGKMRFYIIENIISDHLQPKLYIIESETSASTLMRYLKENKVNAVVVSFGGVENVQVRLPMSLQSIRDKNIIIDYDGDKKKYLERIDKYKHYRGRVLTLELEKGEDINSLYCNGQIDNYKHIIIND